MIESIIETFTGLDTFGWLSQASAILAFIFLGIGYLFPKRKFLILATIAQLCFVLESAFVLLYPSALCAVVSLVRNIVTVIFLFKYNKELKPLVVYLFAGAAVALNLLFIGLTNSWGDFTQYIPMICSCLVTFTQNAKNEYVVKIGGTSNELLWVVYYVAASLPFSILREVILTISGIVGIILLIVHKRKQT